MAVTFRNHTESAGITDDYYIVRDFFTKRGYAEYTFARWDWMTTHTYLNKSTVGFMGIWEEYDQVIGVLALDGDFGDVFCITLSGYDHIKGEMMDYAINHLALTDDFGIVIADEDAGAQSIAASLGLVASESKESDAVFLVDETSTDYVLPKGYTITSMKENLDLHLYGQVIWEGFNHELPRDASTAVRG